MASEEVRDIVENEEKKVETSYPNNYTHTSKGPSMNDFRKISLSHSRNLLAQGGQSALGKKYGDIKFKVPFQA